MILFVGYYGIAVQINAGRVDISLKKEDPHNQWESIGTFLAGHGVSTIKNRRGERERERERERVTLYLQF